MNVAYQVARHLACHMEHWPKTDRAACARDIRRAVLSGNAWLWPEPKQLDLFA
jgi:hypothetical protein